MRQVKEILRKEADETPREHTDGAISPEEHSASLNPTALLDFRNKMGLLIYDEGFFRVRLSKRDKHVTSQTSASDQSNVEVEA